MTWLTYIINCGKYGLSPVLSTSPLEVRQRKKGFTEQFPTGGCFHEGPTLHNPLQNNTDAMRSNLKEFLQNCHQLFIF